MKPKDGTADRLSQLLDAATEGLAGDAELRLDVRAELASHIEEKRDELGAKGHNDNEALDLALKSFGPATDLAGELVEANKRRMKLRAVARLAVRAALVPAAVVVAVLISGGLVLRVRGGNKATQSLFEYGIFVPPGIPKEKVFLFTGDLSRPSRAERQRAIWEAHPESKVYYGNYISHLAYKVLGYTVRPGRRFDLDRFEKEVRHGQALDPGNARYNYLLAAAFLAKACEFETKPVHDEKGMLIAREELVVRDRTLLDRAMAEILKAASKPHLRTYANEMARERLSLLPPARRIEDQYLRISLLADRTVTDPCLHHYVARAIPHCAELLASEGRSAEARRLLATWYPLIKHVAGRASLIDYMDLAMARCILYTVETEYGRVYEKLGDHEEAERTRARAKRLAKSVDTDVDTVKPLRGTEKEMVRESGSAYAQLVHSRFHRLDRAELAPGRQLEHALLEWAALSFMLALLVLWMLGAFVTALRWRWAQGGPGAPLLLLSSWGQVARNLGLGVVLPIVVFYAYTRWSGIAGREYSISYLAARFLLELCVLIATISSLTYSMACEAIRERCRSLAIPAPEGLARRSRIAYWTVLGVLWASCLALRGWTPATVAAYAVAGICGLVVLSYPAIKLKRLLSERKEYGRFHGTLARSMIPVFAAAAILIGAIAHPYLTRLESVLVQRDPILNLDEELLAIRPEADLVRRLRTEIKAAILEVDSEIEAEKAQKE